MHRGLKLRLGQQIDQRDLGQGHQGEANPSEGLAKPQAAMEGRAEAELELDRTQLKGIAVAQNRFPDRLAIHRGAGLLGGYQHRPLSIPQFDARVVIPDAIGLDAQVIFRGTPD